MKVLSKNKKAHFDFALEEKWTAGLVLAGHEVKSLKNWGVSLQEAVVVERGGAFRLEKCLVQLYAKTSPQQVRGYEPARSRKLLLNEREIKKILGMLQNRVNHVVPVALLLSRGRVKLEIGVGPRKKNIQKKQYLKEKAIEKSTRKEMKNYL